MRNLVLSLFACLAITATASANDLRIHYSHAGLTGVTVTEQRQLHFAWHTGRLPYEKGDSSPLRQSLEGYDSHSAIIWLTKEELDTFKQWIKKHRIFDLKPKYPEPEEKTYGSAFHSSLTVEFGGKKHFLTWTGDTKVPGVLHEAINDLVQMCHEIRKSREDK